KFDRAVVTPAMTVRDLAGTVHFQPAVLNVDDVAGSLAGGHLSGSLAFRRNADALAGHVKLAIADVSAATLLGPAMNVAGGQLGLTLEADGLGPNLNALMGSLHGERGAELALDGSLHVSAADIDARLTLSQAPPPNALIAARPELSVAVKGPLGAPTRAVDTSALVSWLTLRAAELQTRRIEAIEANRQQGAVAQAPHPEPPDLRMPLSGVVVETAAPPNASAAPPPARALERLQPPPAPSPPLVPDNNQTGSGNAAPAPLPPKDSRAAPRPGQSAATAGTPEPSQPPGVLQLLLPKILG